MHTIYVFDICIYYIYTCIHAHVYMHIYAHTHIYSVEKFNGLTYVYKKT